MNTDFWLDEITWESRPTREFICQLLLQGKFALGKTVNKYRFCREMWNYSQSTFGTTFGNLKQPDLLRDRC